MIGTRSVTCAPGIEMGDGHPLVVIAGPCALEAEDICYRIAETMKNAAQRLGLPYVFKASFDKANRTSVGSSRGPGLDEGLKLLAKIKNRFELPVLTDIHDPKQAAPAAEVVDILQIPAFLCRQTDLLIAAGQTGLPVNIKKGQFLAPEDMRPAVEKVASSGNEKIILTERGSSFGYHNLVVDMRGLNIMASIGCPVVFDATHSVQLPGGQGTSSGGQREFVPVLARAAAAVGIHGLFLEVHPEPKAALSDGANCLELGTVEKLLREVKAIHELGR